MLRKGPVAAVAAFSYRVRTPEDLDKAVAFYTELGCRVERRSGGLHEGHRRLGARRGPARVPLRVLLRRRARRAPRVALRPAHAGRARAARPLQPGHPRRAARRGVHAGPRLPRHRGHPGRRGHRLRRVDAPQADRARHRHDRRRRPPHAPRRLRDAREAQHPRDLRQARRAAPLGRDRARPRPPRRLERVLPVPARPRRPPRRDLHAGLLHRRPRQPRRHVGRARQPAPRLVGQPRRAVLVHRGIPRARPRRQPAAGRRPHRHQRDGRHHRCRRLLVHPPRRGRGTMPSGSRASTSSATSCSHQDARRCDRNPESRRRLLRRGTRWPRS